MLSLLTWKFLSFDWGKRLSCGEMPCWALGINSRIHQSPILGGKAGAGLTLGTATRKTGAISQRLASAGLCPYTLIGVTVLKDIDVLICLWV